YAEVRAKILTDPVWAASLERLRRDAERIARAAVVRPAPDVRLAVHTKRTRRQMAHWLGRLSMLSGIATVLVLLALLIGSEGSITIGPTVPRLFVVDRSNDQLLVLNPDDGTLLHRINVGSNPSKVLYDYQRDQLYVLTSDSIEVIDPYSFAIDELWMPPTPFERSADMVFDAERNLLYISSAEHGRILAVDVDTPRGHSFAAGSNPTELALASGRLFAVDSQEASIWFFDLIHDNRGTAWFDRNNLSRRGWLTSGYGEEVYVLRGGQPPLLHRFDPDDHPGEFVPLDHGAPVWDITRVGDKLVVARGDGQHGGLDIIDSNTLATTSHLDPSSDQHTLVNGPNETVFGFNWAHGTITHYNVVEEQVLWHTTLDGQQPYEGVFVPGRWQFP
ncbi:MAG: hypothetical protein AAGF95_34500, partial [Chloroflexota bacterium]